MKKQFSIFKKAFLIFTLLSVIFSLAGCKNSSDDNNTATNEPDIKLEAFKDEATSLYGYKDDKGNTVIPCEFERAGEFSDGRALVKKDSRFGFIDKSGNIVIPCIYKEAGDFSCNRALVREDGKLGFIDTDGNAVTEFIFDNATRFSKSGYATVFVNGESYIIDTDGNKADIKEEAQTKPATEE